MKIAFISDIHSNLEALKAVLDKINSLGIKQIYCLGDLIGYGANPTECLKIIKKIKIPCLCGNHEWAVVNRDLSWFNPVAAQALKWTSDKLDDKELSYIKTFREKMFIKKDLKILLVHGSPKTPLREYVYANDVNENFIKNLDCDVLIMGHTHVPFVKKLVISGNSKLVINCGSVGQPRDSDNRASFALLDTAIMKTEIIRVEYDIRAAAEKIIKVGLPEFLAYRLYLGV